MQKMQNLLKKHNQSHLLSFSEQLSLEKREKLFSQLKKLDFEKIDQWVETLVKNHPAETVPSRFEPADYYPAVPEGHQLKEKYDKAVKIGNKLISEGKIAAFVVAGGQGTRLGFDGPKGNYPISPVKNKTLFQIFAEKIASASKKYNIILPWYIMTSPPNHSQTKELFLNNNHYSLDKNKIFIFQQGTLPNFDFEGNILLADEDKLALSPNGHGGSISALYDSGAVEDMKRRGIELISYFQVDNPLINIFDPLFIGLHVLDKSQMSSKALAKEKPKDKVGNFCLVDDKVTVIEYSDLPDELAEKRKPDGTLVFNLGSIAIHMINRTFVEQLNSEGFALPLHRAVKKIPHVDENGNYIKPSKPNGIKLESFIFDALPLANKSITLETLKEQEFAPLKNASGVNGPDDVKKRMIARDVEWLESAGIKIPRKPDGSIDAAIEIAPSFALEKADIKDKIDEIPKIKPGTQIYLE